MVMILKYGNPSDSIIEYLEKYINEGKLLMKSLGQNILEKVDISKEIKNAEKFYMKGKNYDAKLILTSDNEVILLKGSKVANVSNSLLPNDKKLREDNQNKLKNNVLQEDIVLKSLSKASHFVTGCNVNQKRYLKRDE